MQPFQAVSRIISAHRYGSALTPLRATRRVNTALALTSFYLQT